MTPTPDSGFTWTRKHVIALIVLCLAALLDTIDATVVNVAMPAVKDALHFSEGGLAWMVNAYMIPFGGFLLLAGRAGDVLGRRRILIAGTTLFTLSSLGSALAPDAAVMIATRAAEGLAAAFVVPTTLAMLTDVFPAGPGRNRAFALWGGGSAIAGTLGLIFGGMLVSTVGWRWIFLINIPVGAFVIAAALRSLPADVVSGPHRRFDLAGAVAATGGASLLAYAVVQTGSHPWGSARTVGLLTGAVVLIGYFLVHERFVAAEPLMPLALWRNRSVAGANVVSALVSSAVFAMFYSTTLDEQQVLGYSALRTGLAYVPLGLSILVAAGLGPVLVPRIGVRFAIAIGSLIAAGGMVLLTSLPVAANLLTHLIVPEVIVGFGAGLAFIPSSIAALAGVPPERNGVASSLLNVSRQLGGALGLAVVSTIVASGTIHALSAGKSTAAAMTTGFHSGFAIGTGLLIGSAVAALTLLREDGRGQAVNLVELQGLQIVTDVS
jgi:EmrB/QacA subfamily drug resistance transporter